jgi:two-component system, sporulation sensor kinase E
MLKGNLIKIAIIDDDEDDFFIIADYIKSIEGANLQVGWLPDYASAIAQIKAKSYNIYFIDYRLGNETGLMLLRDAIASGCEEPIVLLTGKGNRSIDIMAMQSGATDYLVKSELSIEKLERCIRYSLERAAALKQLKVREMKYRNLFEGAKDAVVITDSSLKIMEANHAASVLCGYEQENIIGNNLCDYIKDNSQKTLIQQKVDRQSTITDMEIDILCGNNKELRPSLLSISFQKNQDNSWLLHCIIHDITNLKRAELANLQAQKLAANEKLMRVIAHEIRNPLNNISLSVEHLELSDEEAPMRKELMNIIRRNCGRINKSITELLDLTRTGELEFKKESLQEIMNESIAAVSDRIGLQNVKVEKVYQENPLEISADKSKLKIAFSNILINAIEAMNGNKDKGKLAVTLQASPDLLTVSIKDNGIGIAEENIPKLFEPFFTLKKNGIGLGLATSYSILQCHNASVHVESQVNKGTNFIINFTRN